MTDRKQRRKCDNIIRGIPAAAGLAMGPAYLYVKDPPRIEKRTISVKTLDAEVERLEHAIAKSKKELTKILAFAHQKVGEAKAKIFEAQIMILDDRLLIDAIIKRVRSERRNAEFTVNDEIGKYASLMLASHDEYMHERAHDVEDLKNRIIRNLQEEKLISKLEGSVIVLAHTLTPADTMILSRNKILGYATDLGGVTSHAALLSRSLKIPAVVGLGDITRSAETGDELIIDGYSGIVVVKPTEECKQEYVLKRQRFEAFEAALVGFKDLPAVTADGHSVELSANIELREEIDYVVLQGSQGVGLYRSENLLIGRDDFPSEEEQYGEYKEVAGRMYPHRVIMRTFDIGGDKVAPAMAEEPNPFLGWRGIRISLDRPDLFLNQLRAMLRASTRRNLAIMFPMVTDIGQLRRAKECVRQAKAELRSKKIKFHERIPVGVMIEVPAAALDAEQFAAEVDFLSIGTNDLIQYLLAVDRGNSLVAGLYQEFHPSVIRTLKRIIEAGHHHGKWVGICGEMAGNPLATPLLLGLGMDEFSVVPSILPEIKKIIRSLKYTSVQSLASKVLKLTSADEISEYLRAYMRKECPDIPIDADASM